MVKAYTAIDDDKFSRAGLACSGYCLYKYSIMKAIGLAGFSISKFSTIDMKREFMFLLLRYCCNSAWTSAACQI